MKYSTLVSLVLITVGCVSIPKISGEQQAKLDKLEAAGKPGKEIKSPVLAGVLNIIPGAGQAYAEDYGDAALTFLTFWLVIPYYLGFVDAIQESRVRNAEYTIQYYKNQGFRFGLYQQNPLTRYSLALGRDLNVSQIH